MSGDSQLSEEQLMTVVEKIGDRAIPETLPMMPSSAMTFSDAHRLDVAQNVDSLSSDSQVAIRARLTDEPSGYVVVMISREDTETLTRAMLSDINMDDAEQDMIRDAAQELGNLLISNYLDTLAEVFDHNIDYKAPNIMTDNLDEIVANTSKMSSNRYAFVYKAGVKVGDDALPVFIYHFPELEEMVSLVKQVL